MGAYSSHQTLMTGHATKDVRRHVLEVLSEQLNVPIEKMDIDTIHTNSLTRCRHTARIIAGARTIIPHPALNEINLGQWGGRRFDEIQQQDPEGFRQRGEHLDTFRPLT
ncbi:MAG: histidine phosphatase family protein [Desulfobacteraceae bacterium]|nr:histidine phosphatase family protein [Desulfobacteraceae bacterium]